MNLFVEDPLRSWFLTIYGALLFVILVYLGLHRTDAVDSLVIGTWMAVVSGLCWYLSAVVPLATPQLPHVAGGLNVAAASFAAGSASYLVPDDKIGAVLKALGLGLLG